MEKFKGRKPEQEDKLPSMTLPGDVKERLQFRPLQPGKKKPAGENWRGFKSEDNVGGNSHITEGRKKLPVRAVRDSYDDVEAQERAYAQRCLAEDGMIHDRDAMSDRATETHNEHLMEEVTDKQTGKKSLLFRADYFSRI